MTFMGSKAKYAKYIVPIIQKCIDDNDIKVYYEPFCGGCNIVQHIKCEQKIASDKSDVLIALLIQMRDDFSKVLKDGSRELWDKGKAYVKDGYMPDDMTLAEIGAMGYFASYNNGGYCLGYANNSATRNYFNEAYRNAEKQAPFLKGVEFKCCRYEDCAPEDIKGACFYLDPPYKGTRRYDYAQNGTFDYEKYWNWVRQISKDNYVFASEQTAPDDFQTIWQKEINRTMTKDNKFKAVEKLFVYENGLTAKKLEK